MRARSLGCLRGLLGLQMGTPEACGRFGARLVWQWAKRRAARPPVVKPEDAVAECTSVIENLFRQPSLSPWLMRFVLSFYFNLFLWPLRSLATERMSEPLTNSQVLGVLNTFTLLGDFSFRVFSCFKATGLGEREKTHVASVFSQHCDEIIAAIADYGEQFNSRLALRQATARFSESFSLLPARALEGVEFPADRQLDRVAAAAKQPTVFTVVDAWSVLLPARIATEDLGDYIEDIHRRISDGQRLRPWLRAGAAVFWTAINAIGYALKQLGRTRAN